MWPYINNGSVLLYIFALVHLSVYGVTVINIWRNLLTSSDSISPVSTRNRPVAPEPPGSLSVDVSCAVNNTNSYTHACRTSYVQHRWSNSDVIESIIHVHNDAETRWCLILVTILVLILYIYQNLQRCQLTWQEYYRADQLDVHDTCGTMRTTCTCTCTCMCN